MKKSSAITTERACEHCGTPFLPETETEAFCCAGCAFVHDLIGREGLGQFYDLKGDDRLLPAGASVLTPGDSAWAVDQQTTAEAAARNGLAETKLDLHGVSCVGCVWLIEALFQREPGSARIAVDSNRGEVVLSWIPGEFLLSNFVEKVGHFGYRLAPATGRNDGTGASGLRLGLAGGLAMNAMAFTFPRYFGMEKTFELAGVFELVAAASATLSLLACGSYFIGRAWSALRLRRLHLDVPIALGIVAAWVGSLVGWLGGTEGLLYFDFVAMFIFLMLLGRRLQEVSVAKNRSRLLRADPLLQSVTVVHADAEKPVPVDDLACGMELVVPPSGVVPVNADLLGEPASLSLEWINGEADPRLWEAGSAIPAGAVNLGRQPIRLRARENWTESLLARLSRHAGDAPDDPAARWLNRLLRGYLAAVLGLAVVGGAAWWAHSGKWTSGLQVMISVLVVSCPCALGVAIPLAHELSVVRLRRSGLFVRRPDVWGRLRHVKRLVFDKTGTLTLEMPKLENVSTLRALPPAAKLALGRLVQESRHPLAASLRQALVALGGAVSFPHDESVREIPGAGVVFTDAAGAVWSLGRPDWHPPGAVKIDTCPEDGDTLLRCDGISVAPFRFFEAARPDAHEEITRLRGLGFDIDILSGDRPEKVAALAASVGLPMSRALSRLSPEDKAQWVATHAPDSLFIGDGANDSLAFDAALVRGTPAVGRGLLAEKADFYFLSRGLHPVRELFETARCRRRAVLQAFAFAFTYNVAVVAAALAGHMSPLLAAVLMPLSSLVTLVIVTSNHRRS